MQNLENKVKINKQIQNETVLWIFFYIIKGCHAQSKDLPFFFQIAP